MGIKPQESNEAELLRFVVLSKHYEFCIFIFNHKAEHYELNAFLFLLQ